MSSFPSNSGPSFHPEIQSQSQVDSAGLRHLTIRQVLTAAHIETHFEIDGRKVGFVALLANVYDVSFRGAKLNYGLDDGSGRIKAFSWVTDDGEAERECAEFQEVPFYYARVIGKISEFRGIYSIELTKISRIVKEPHEIHHHKTRAMVESLMYKRGPPSRAIVESAIQTAEVKFPPPTAVAIKLLRNNISTPFKQMSTSSVIPPRTPSPETPQTPRRAPASVPHSQKTSDTLPVVPRLNTVPRRSHRIDSDFSSPGTTHDPVSPTRVRPRSPSGPSLVSTTALTHYKTTPPLFPIEDRNVQRFPNSEDVRRISPPGEFTVDPIPDMSATGKKVVRQRDPYSHLSNLERDIILTIQNTSSTVGDEEQGISIRVLVQTIAQRRADLDHIQFNDAFTFLLEEGYIYNTVDETHVACT